MNGYRDRAREHQRRLAEQAEWCERIAVPRFARIDPEDALGPRRAPQGGSSTAEHGKPADEASK